MLWIATAVGAALGAGVASISRVVSRRFGGGEFWVALPELARDLVSQSDSDLFLRNYGRLLRLLAAYLFRNALQLGAAFAPVIATVVLLGPSVMELYNRGATELAVHPAQNLRIEADGAVYTTNSLGSAIVPAPDFAGSGVAAGRDGQFEVANPRRNSAWCTTEWGRLGMALLGFDTFPATDATGSLVLRPRRGDTNPLWPYLNDLEFFFYLAMTVASGLTALILKSRGR
jgi:hypothetical protein